MIYIILFILSVVLTFFIKEYALKKSLVAEVNERSSHTTPTPHGGGIAIAITWFVGISYLYSLGEIAESLYFSLMVGIIISVVSYIDDLYELSAKFRLLVQALVALLALYILGGLESLDLFIFTIENQFITNTFAFFMIVWFINLYNFLDGIDGYAATETLFLSLSAFVLFGGAHFLVLAVGVFGFLLFNWHKAKIFMGDVGSTMLGYNVAVFTIYYTDQNAENFWIWIILFGLFWFDATLTLFRRFRKRETLSEAHKKHAYQRLTQSGFSHSKVVIYSLGINMILFSIVYFQESKMLAFLIAFIVLYLSIKYVDKHKGFS